MNDNVTDTRNELPAGIRQRISAEAFSALIAAALMLYFGWTNSYSSLIVDPLYEFSLQMCTVTMRYGGIALVVSAVLLGMSWRYALAFDAVLSGLIGTSFLVTGLIWMSRSDTDGYLFVIFAALFLHAAWRVWMGHTAVMAAIQAMNREPQETPQPVDWGAKDAARQRLFDNISDARADRVAAEEASRQEPEPVAESEPLSEPEPVSEPEPMREPEPPGGGFLADLGRDDDDK